RLPQSRQFLSELARGRNRPLVVLACFECAARVAAEDRIALDDRTDRAIDRQLVLVGIDEVIARADQRRDEIVERLERIAQVPDLAEPERTRVKQTLVPRERSRFIDLFLTIALAEQIQRIRLEETIGLR